MILPLLFALSSLVVTPERPISPSVLEPAAGVQQRPAVASNGRGWLAAWYSNGEIVAARLDESGTLLDPAPIVIAANGSPVAVTAGNGGYLVVWAGAGGVQARLVSSDGSLSPPVTVANATTINNVDVAFAAGRFLVTWSDTAGTPLRQMGRLLDANAAPLGDAFLLIDGAAGISAVAGGANDFLAVGDLLDTASPLHPFPQEVFAVRVSADGHVSAPLIVSDPASPVSSGSARALWTGSDYVVAWSTNQGGLGETRGARIGAGNAVTPVPPFYSGVATLSALIWNGSGVLATLRDTTSIQTVFVANGGASAPKLVTQPWFAHPATLSAAWNGRAMLVVYGSAGEGDIWAKLTDAAGAPLDAKTQEPGIAVALSPPEQGAPAVSASVLGSGIVWNEAVPENASNGLLMTIVRGDTSPEGSGTLLVSPAPRWRPRVAFAGTLFAYPVARGTDPALAISTLTPSQGGSVVSLQIHEFEDVAWDGSAFVVTGVVHKVVQNAFGGQITAVRVSPNGSIVSGPLPLSQPAALLNSSNSSVASNGNGSLVVWTSPDLEAATITAGGSPSGVIPIAKNVSYATVRWNGQAYVISAISIGDTSVRWFLVNASGTLLNSSAPVPIASPGVSWADLKPRSASFGATTLVAWIDGNDIRGVLIRSDDGSPLGEPFVIATANAPHDLDMDGEGDTIRVVYQAENPYPGVPYLNRVYTRTVALAPAPPRRRAVK